jgi:hypothetical protein
MDLGLAGVISGAGEGASKALTMAQAQFGAASLQAERDKMDDLRQERLLAHQAGEGAANRELTKGEGAATRASAEANTGMQIASHEAMTERTLESQGKLAGEHNTTSKEIAKSSQENALEIAKLSNKMHLSIASMTRALQEKQFDKTFTASKMTATTAALKDLTDEMIHLNVAVSNPLADKSSPEYKTAVELLQRAQRTHQVYQEQLAKMISSGPGGLPAAPEFPGKVEGAANPPPLPAFVPPPMASKPGLVQTPQQFPSAD